MPKFFVHKNQKEEESIVIIGEDVNHIKNVLRLKENENIIVCVIEENKSYESIIEKLDKEQIKCKIIKEINKTTEPNTYIHLFQGLPKAEKMEWIIEKGTEVGISEFTPVIMKRSIVKVDEKNSIKKQQRWKKISEVAAKQSGRDCIPIVNNIMQIKDFQKIKENYDSVLIAYEQETENTLKKELKKAYKQNLKIAIIVGPEGGIEEEELEFFKQQGAKVITLGKRILRTETAPLVLAANILYEFEM